MVARTSELAQRHPQINEDEITESIAQNRSFQGYISQPEHDLENSITLVTRNFAKILDMKPIEVAKSADISMQRESNLTIPNEFVPRPKLQSFPTDRTEYEDTDSNSLLLSDSVSRTHENDKFDSFKAYYKKDMELKQWIGLKVLGEGTFSKVILAKSVNSNEVSPDESRLTEQLLNSLPSKSISHKENSDKLVAVKICEFTPKNGATENNLEISVRREIDILKDITHPSIVHLKAWNIEETRAFLILDYCPGGDLFLLASERHDLLVPELLRRIFAELVAAVQYLHANKIVHRDVKLENVLVNLTYHELECQHDWSKYPNSVVTLTDFGLSRRINDNEKLATRCGSDDYAAPEVIMGQPYDGRATDAWSLGVLLYALLEGRLPFDPVPDVSENYRPRSRTSHLIARIEWRWVKHAKNQADHQSNKEKIFNNALKGAMQITESLLKRARNRWTLDQVESTEWVRGAIQIDRIKFRDEE